MAEIVPNSNDIDDVLDQCMESESKGRSKFPGMSYEEGVSAAIRWMRGEERDNPMAE